MNEPQYELNHKCENCGFQFGDHSNIGRMCPIGTRHRVMGFTTYSSEDFFKPVMPTVSRDAMKALAGLTGDAYDLMTPDEIKASYVHMLKLRTIIRTLSVENRQLQAELKEAKKWKA